MQLGLYGVMYFSLYFASSLAFYDAVCEAKEKHMFETATAVCLIVLTVQLSCRSYLLQESSCCLELLAL